MCLMWHIQMDYKRNLKSFLLKKFPQKISYERAYYTQLYQKLHVIWLIFLGLIWIKTW